MTKEEFMAKSAEERDAYRQTVLLKHGARPVTIKGLARAFDTHSDQLVGIFKDALRQRDERIVALELRTGQLETKLAAGPSVKWAGPWNAARGYTEGELVQKNGLWLALADNTNHKPGQSSCWRLIVKAVERDTGA